MNSEFILPLMANAAIFTKHRKFKDQSRTSVDEQVGAQACIQDALVILAPCVEMALNTVNTDCAD